MNRLVIFGTLFSFSIPSLSADLARDGLPAHVTVLIYDYAAIDKGLLGRAQNVASAVMAQAGAVIRWKPVDLTEAGSSTATDRKDNQGPVLLLRLHRDATTKKFNLKGWQYGYSIPAASRFSDIAGVIVERAANLARAQGADPHVVLGHIIAHELGHLLLGPDGHARQGIMKHRWRARDLRLAQMGALVFSAAQAHRMRKQIAARTGQQNRMETAVLLDVNAPPPTPSGRYRLPK